MDSLYKFYKFLSRRPVSVSFYVTNRCNSRCKICNIWNLQPKQDMSIEILKKIISDPLINKKTLLGIQGGELFCHPNWKDILRLLKGYNYSIYTNGIMKDIVIEATREFKPKNLCLSLDGDRETYKRVRGVDKFDNNIEIIKTLANEVPIQINFVINPWNKKKDLIFVKKLADKYNLELVVTIYETPEYFKTKKERRSNIYDTRDVVGKNRYLDLYNKWIKNAVILPCNSIRVNFVVLPDGSVNMCQSKNIVLGDLNKQTVSEIWFSKRTKELHKKYRKCNSCWFICQRPSDIKLISTLRKILPSFLVKKIVGEYKL